MSKDKIRNVHCTYFEGQTGLCQAKEFVKCNPVNCKLYIIDELTTIKVLQEKLKYKEKECEKLKTQILSLQTMEIEELKNYKQALDEIEKTANKNFTHTAWEEYEKQLMQILDIINKAKDSE